MGRFNERLVRPDRRIVDQDVDSAELGQRFLGQRIDLGLFATSASTATALTPRFRASRATLSASCRLARALITTCALSPASLSIVARPILRPDPLTSATFPRACSCPDHSASRLAYASQRFRTARWPLPSEQTVCRGCDAGPAQCGKNRLLHAMARARLTPCKPRCEHRTASYCLSPLSRRRPLPAQRPHATPLQPPRRRGCQRKSAGSGGRTDARRSRT